MYFAYIQSVKFKYINNKNITYLDKKYEEEVKEPI